MKRALACCGLFAAPVMAACLIQGKVLDSVSGKPLAGARVFAKMRGAGSKPAILRLTGEPGTFCFERLEPGRYLLAAEHSGYLSIVQGAKLGEYDGTSYEVDGGTEIPAVTLKMLRAASISGRVTDADGEAVEGAVVNLSKKVWNKGWSPDRSDLRNSDDRGAFRFTHLAPGTYYLSVEPKDEPGPELADAQGKRIRSIDVPTFYATSLAFARATPIPIKAGENVANVTLTMTRVAARRLSGTLPPPAEPVARRPTILVRSEELGTTIDVPVAKDGAFLADNLWPVKYVVSVATTVGPVRTEVDLIGGDVEGLVLAPEPVFELRITARVEGNSTRPARIVLWGIDSDFQRNAAPDAHGIYVFTGIPSGSYRFRTNEEKMFLKSVIVDGTARPANRIEILGGTPGAVEVVFTAKPARVDGRVDGPPPALPATVVLMSEGEMATEVEGYFRAVDPTGNFQRDQLAPGNYRAFVIEGFEEDLWGSPELAAALRGKSVTFELGEGESVQIAVPVTSSEEWAAALRQIGL